MSGSAKSEDAPGTHSSAKALPARNHLSTGKELAAAVKQEAGRLGFELCGIAPAVVPGGFHPFCDWLERGFAGEMNYLPRRREAYRHPDSILNGVRSLILLGMNYNSSPRADATGDEPRTAGPQIARYAFGQADYHDLIRERLSELCTWLKGQRPGSRNRGVVDTAPLLERDFARLAGLGWFGKNTLLINKRAGSWLFLAAVLTDIELPADAPHAASHCGHCQRCLEVCPTHAFVEPYVLDARRCIAYLTIEHRGPIDPALRPQMGDWLFGCDLCQEVCPWNRKAPLTAEPAFHRHKELAERTAVDWLLMSDEQFSGLTAQSPLSRPGREGMARNAAIVLGNRRDEMAVDALGQSLTSERSPLVRGAAAWALGQIGSAAARHLLQTALAVEPDDQVRAEIGQALTASTKEAR